MANIEYTFIDAKDHKTTIRVKAGSWQKAVRELEKEKKAMGIKAKMVCVSYARNPAECAGSEPEQKELY